LAGVLVELRAAPLPIGAVLLMVERIALDGAVNARDLGGLRTSHGDRIAPHRLLRADNLQDLSPRDIERLVGDFGLTTVIDVRSVEELDAEGPGPLRAHDRVEHRHRSLVKLVDGTGDEVAREVLLAGREPLEAAERHTRTANHYLGYLQDRPDSVVAALRDIADAPGAALVHCAAGKDRTGVVVALALLVAGVPRADVVADYVATGEVIEQIMARLSPRPIYTKGVQEVPLEEHAPGAAAMEAFLDLVDSRFGGLERWLADQGFDAGDQQRLADRLLGRDPRTPA
jgi:protein-tyrosine phosphatase